MKGDEKLKRVRYIRALERFSTAVVKAIKKEDFDEVRFGLLVEKNYKILAKIEPVFLDQPYTKGLCEFVNFCLKTPARSDIIRAANALDKLKNAKSYKKERNVRITEE